ncbi:MAG: DUF58 domain-containing protein [Ruminococcus sp.]|nr:DUF58 domain-containing protein [Ruminococcus sp.]
MIVVYFLLMIVAGLFYILYNGPVSFYLFFFLLSLPIAGFIWILIASKKTTVTFKSDSRVYPKGHDSPFMLRLENNSPLLIPNAIIYIRYTNSLTNKGTLIKIVTPIYSKNVQLLRLSATSDHYGSISAKIEKIKLFDLLRLTRIKLSKKNYQDTPVSVTFIPEYIQLENNVTNYADYGLESDKYSTSKPGDDPSEIFDLHEYNDGDKISRIHWKLTAKTDTTYVKDYSLPISNSICMAANVYMPKNAQGELDRYDAVIEAFYSIGAYLSENAIPHTMVWYDERIQKTEERLSQEIEDDTDNIRDYLKNARNSQDHEVLYSFFANMTEGTKYGHLIYITNTIDDKILQLLISSETAFRYTVLLASGDEEIDAGQLYDNVEIINIHESKIDSSISGLTL